MKNLPRKPYLFHAMLDWIRDSELTPHIVCNAAVPGIVIPEEHVRDGKIVLNISSGAVSDFIVHNDATLEFNARFNGVERHLYIPGPAITGIYARENGQGMLFKDEVDTSPPEPQKPKLRVIK